MFFSYYCKNSTFLCSTKALATSRT